MVVDILQDYSQKIIEELRASLDKVGKGAGDASGGLAQSITANVKVFNQVIEMTISMDDYWKFVDKGVDGTEITHGSPFKYKKGGKPIPVSAMLKHIANRGLKAKPKKSLKVKGKGKLSKKIKKGIEGNERESFAWAIGAKVKKEGLKPTHFATDVFEGDLLDNMKKDVAESLGREIAIDIAIDFK